MRRALQYSAVAGRPLALHCEEPTLSRDGQMREGAVSAELGFAGWPSVAESVMVERDLSLAAFEGRPVHLMHLSAARVRRALRRALADGVRASGEASPHHLCATDELVRSLDPNVKMNPPLGTEDDRRALVEAVRDGTIACIATDHAPHALHEKEAPFEEAPFGVTGLETAFAVLNTDLVRTGELPLAIVLERMSAGPARVFGLPVPRIAVGEVANLVLLDLEQTWTVRADAFRSRSTNSWLLGRTLTGAVVKTVAAGGVVFARMSGTAGYLLLEDGTAFAGSLGAADGVALRRGGVHDRHDRLPGDRHRPQLRRAADLLHRADGRQLRRRRRAARVDGAARARGADAPPRWRRLGGVARGHGVVALDEIDTRRLDAAPARRRRDARGRRRRRRRAARRGGARRGPRAQPTMTGAALVAAVSTPAFPTSRTRPGPRAPSALVDYGAKRSIVHRLASGRRRGHGVPARGRRRRAPSHDGVLLSNGPGDPEPLVEETEAIRATLGPRPDPRHLPRPPAARRSRPGTRPYKLPFGHRGANHPVLDRRSGRVLVTSQNHGFAVACRAEDAEATHVSLYDGTVEGFDFPDLRAQSVQFHPEAGPGPHDAWPILERWVEAL